MYYSQHGEDILLERIFRKRSEGICVEVGANDGITFSTTKRFEDLGRKCLLVEPAPSLCQEIKRNRSSILYECAASSEEGEIEFHYVEGGSVYSSVEQISTMREEVASRGFDVKVLKVKKRRLDDMLAEAGLSAIDFLTVDVEGHELEVLKGLDFRTWDPSVVLVEDANSDLEVTEVERFMRTRGYVRFLRSGGNDWYAKKGCIPLGAVMGAVLEGVVRLSGVVKVILPDSWRRPAMSGIRKIKERLRAIGLGAA